MTDSKADNHHARSRIFELDVLRGFALAGIFIVNIAYFAQPLEISDFPTLIGQSKDLNAFAWIFEALFVEGSMYGLFAMLFGASSLLLLNDQHLSASEAIRVVDHYFRRMLWLVLFGLIHAYFLLSPMEILFTYGVLGLLLFPLRQLKPVYLSLAGGGLFFTGIYDYSFALDNIQQQLDTAAGVVSHDDGGTIMDKIIASYNLYRSGYSEIFMANIELVAAWQSVNFYEDHIYDAGGMMLIGMALFQWHILDGQRRARFYLLLAVGGYGVAFILRWPGIDVFYSSGFDPAVNAELATAPALFSRLFLTLGHIGLIISLLKLHFFRPVLNLLASAGCMALTNYILQTLFAIFVFYGFGLARYGQLERYQLLAIALVFAALQLAFSAAWLKFFRHGPLEWLWRSLVELRPQTLVRA